MCVLTGYMFFSLGLDCWMYPKNWGVCSERATLFSIYRSILRVAGSYLLTNFLVDFILKYCLVCEHIT